MMLTAEEALSRLEERLRDVMRQVSTLEEKNRVLTGEIQQLKRDVEEARKESELKAREIRSLKEERSKIHAGAERILEKLAVLEGLPHEQGRSEGVG